MQTGPALVAALCRSAEYLFCGMNLMARQSAGANNNEGNGPIAVAKITAIQAVLVALITAMGGVLGFLIAGSGKDVPQQSQYWLDLHKIEGPRGAAVRVEISVNGVMYAYPARGVWAAVGPDMSPQSMPLPVGGRRLRISFRAMVAHPGLVPVEEATSQEVHDLDTNAIPAEKRVYNLYLITKDGAAAETTLRVFYSVAAR
jgi:hypothetical protein